MTGGAGRDRFALADLSETGLGAGRDVITDFLKSQGDRIDLSGLDADPGMAGRQAYSFIGTVPFTVNGPGAINFSFVGTTTIVRINSDADTAAEAELQLTGKINFVAADFFL